MVSVTVDYNFLKKIKEKYTTINHEELEKWIFKKCEFYNKLSQEQLEARGWKNGMYKEFNEKIKDYILLIDLDYNKFELDEIQKEIDKEIGTDITETDIKKIMKESYLKILNVIRDYVDLREDYYPIVTLWILGTYMHKSFRTYPYLYFNAMKGSGKSRLLGLIAYLSYNGKIVVNMSESVLFRTAQNSTICIDEFEQSKGKEKANLRELLNASYKKGVSVERAKRVQTSKGEEWEIERFDTFCPVAVANISGMDEVLADRSIKLTLERTSNESISRKVEIWDLDAEISQILEKLVSFSVVLSSVGSIYREFYKLWNVALKTNITHNIHYITQHYYTHIIEKILSSSLNGRHLELFFPLFVLANYCEILDEVIDIAEKMIKEKKEEDVYENRDISLIEFISKQTSFGEWISQKRLLERFKSYIEAEDDRWLNAQWFGIALKRLNLLKESRRVGSGKEIILNISKAQEKIKMFK